MSGNTGKRKDNPTSSGDLVPMALYNRRNQSAVIMEEQRREMSALKEMLASSSRNAPIDETNPHEDSTNSNNGDTDAN
ncbi:unnamed protein product [Trifolium pratense]|uniref:Uncharacterized protein n=1 Tax=Trifolium pratense TaxID=57577 RepID=A0ACB0J2I7_TRIPR|nr:unnamed protein product [Trifolium pratense]